MPQAEIKSQMDMFGILGKDIPLIVHLADDNGLPNRMTMHYSRSDRSWESIDFLTPVGGNRGHD